LARIADHPDVSTLAREKEKYFRLKTAAVLKLINKNGVEFREESPCSNCISLEEGEKVSTQKF
jgi:hypothetical protein